MFGCRLFSALIACHTSESTAQIVCSPLNIGFGPADRFAGRDILPGVDGRSPLARRYRDVLSALVVDQGDCISEARMALCRPSLLLRAWQRRWKLIS
jgi:hypothetical protein